MTTRAGFRRWARGESGESEPVVGVALSGGGARAIAHLGVLRVLGQHKIPIQMIGGVSAGSMIAAAYASGQDVEDIVRIAHATRFNDVGRWKLSLLGLADSDRMTLYLKRLLKAYHFEEMRMPLAVVATELNSGRPAVFRERGEVFLPIRASCAYPGLFPPLRYRQHLLTDGGVSMPVPAVPLRRMGATHVISVALATSRSSFRPRTVFQVVHRCFQIVQAQAADDWRSHSSAVIEPDVTGFAWNCFGSAKRLIEIGERAARAALPRILSSLELPGGAVEQAA